VGFLSRAGVNVSAESARKVATVYRCVSILANILAMFPKGMFERITRGRREAPDHPLDPLISFKPNRRQTAFEFWRLVCHHLILRQNAFVQIVPGTPGRGWVGQLVPLHPDRIHGPEELPNGTLRYEYRRPNGEKVRMIGGIDIWHMQGLSDDGLKGLSMMDLASDSIGLSIAAERHASRFFERGVKSAGILQSDRSYKRDVADAMGDSFTRKYGGESGAGSVPVLWEGMKFQSVAMNLKDAEFLDSRKFSVAEIARWFGVPPHMVGDVERSTSWGTGIEQQGLYFLVYSLLPWIELLEQSIRFTLVVQADRFYPKFNVNAILRMDAKTQADVFEKHIENGIRSPNECRELLELNPREGGDDFVDPAKKADPPAPPPTPPPGDGDDDDGDQDRALATKLAQARVNELLAEEQTALVKIAQRHAASSKSWRSAVTGFYGRFPRKIAQTKITVLDTAKVWCAARRELVLTNGGLYRLMTNGTPAADDVLLGGFHAED
jgi:HK97 family phage portal protein